MSTVASSGPKTVLIVNPGADVYGSDLQMLESIKAMHEVGWTVHLVVPERGPLVARAEECGAIVQQMSFPVVRRSSMSVRGLAALGVDILRRLPSMVATIRRDRADVVYVNTTTVPWWILAARLIRRPVLCHVHEAENADGGLVLKALNAPLFLCHRLIMISDTAMDALALSFPRLRKRAVLVRNGVPDRASAPVQAPPTEGGFRLTVVARLSPRKATHVAVEATRLLHDEGRDVLLDLVGSPFPGYEWYVAELHEQVEQAGLTSRVEFTGYVQGVHAMFDRAHVALAPSIREPFGNSVVEAQLSERPVVAAAAGGHLESIADGVSGLLVPVEDAAAMAAAVARLMDDAALRAELSLAARRSAVQRFGTERYRREVRAVVEELSA